MCCLTTRVGTYESQRASATRLVGQILLVCSLLAKHSQLLGDARSDSSGFEHVINLASSASTRKVTRLCASITRLPEVQFQLSQEINCYQCTVDRLQEGSEKIE